MIEKLIANLLAKFKQSNPKIWATVALILTSAKVVIENLIQSGVIPEGTWWLEWVFWVIALVLGSGGVAQYQFSKELSSSEARPEKLVHLSDERKYEAVLERNKVLEEIVRKA